MIYDRLNNYKQYGVLGNKFELAFNWLKNTNLKEIEPKRYDISDGIFANVQTLKTKPMNEKKWEVHRKYVDIQYVITGKEKMGYGILEDFKKVVSPYDVEKDVEFLDILDSKKYNFVDVQMGDFVIFYPNDVHAPMLSVDEDREVKKVIVKILID